MMEWISVEQRLPEIISKHPKAAKRIIACDHYGVVFFCYFRMPDKKFIDEHNLHVQGVTHWMELPKPPF